MKRFDGRWDLPILVQYESIKDMMQKEKAILHFTLLREQVNRR